MAKYDDGGESAYLEAYDRACQNAEEAADNFFEWADSCRDKL